MGTVRGADTTPNEQPAPAGARSRLARAADHAGRRPFRLGLALVLVIAGACAQKAPPAKTPADSATSARAATLSVGAGVPTGPAVELAPAASARPYQLMTVSIGSFDRMLSNGARLVSEAVPLPMDPAGLRDMLLTQAGLSPEVSANLDFNSPAGAALVSIGSKGETGVVLAFAARGPAEAEKLINGLGKPVMVRGPVTLIRSAGNGSGWFYRAGNLVVMSDELDALARGAMLALAARRSGPDDVTADIFPDAIARAHGTDVTTAITQLINSARERQAKLEGTAAPARPTPTPKANGQKPGATDAGSADEQSWQPVAELLRLVADADPIEVGLTADPARGLLLRARMHARAGSRLESVARDVRPFELDPTVMGGAGQRFATGATSIGPFSQGLVATQRARLASDKSKGATAALAYYDALLANMAGEQSGSVSLTKDLPYISALVVTPLKDASGAARVASAIAALDGAASSALIRAQLGNRDLLEWSVKKESVGKIRALHYRLKLKRKLGADVDAEPLRKLLGATFDAYLAVADNKLAITVGKDARARLSSIGSGNRAAAKEKDSDKPVWEAARTAKGRDAFTYIDFAPVLGLAASFSPQPRPSVLRGGSGPVPMIVSAGGDGAGKIWSLELTLPVSAFQSIAALWQAAAAAPAGSGTSM